MRLKFNKLFVLSAVLMMCVTPTLAQKTPKQIGEFDDWSAYVFTEGADNKVCYMVSHPKSEEGDYSQRGDVFALITHRPAENSRNVFSYIAGYSYKPESEVTVSIGSQNFTLFTEGESAWTPDQATDNNLTDAIRRGNSVVVKGVSSRGTRTTDTFGLKGSSAAYKAISEACGIK
ncbi:MAG: hypothetical protein H0V39_02425 [Nitrosomonas sp.]|nr:hypothetical protein [Nitrosomonas sp.]